MRRAWIALSAFIFASVLILSAQVVGSEGDGTPEDPYRITNCAELQDMNLDLAAHYVLMNDIDCSDTVNWNFGEGFQPIGKGCTDWPTCSNSFTGTFDGQNHNIIGLYINRPGENYVGLFGYVWKGKITNVGLVDVNVTGSNAVGGLVGANYYGTIINSYSTGSVTGGGTVGGLVGSNWGGVANSYSTGSVTGGTTVGGLVGYIGGYGSISNSYSTGSVSGGSYAGGLVGYNQGFISNSYSTGSVTGTAYLGGLVGYNTYWT